MMYDVGFYFLYLFPYWLRLLPLINGFKVQPYVGTRFTLQRLGLAMEFMGSSLLSDWRALHSSRGIGYFVFFLFCGKGVGGIAAARTCVLIGCMYISSMHCMNFPSGHV